MAQIIGKESLNDMSIKPRKDIIKEFRLDLAHMPLDFSDTEIKNIITKFNAYLPKIETDIQSEVEKIKSDYSKIDLDIKNTKNDLTENYFANEILGESMKYFDNVTFFLQKPRNEDLQSQFFDIVAESRNLILIKRNHYGAFEEIFYFILNKICNDADLRGKRHLYTLLHYM